VGKWLGERTIKTGSNDVTWKRLSLEVRSILVFMRRKGMNCSGLYIYVENEMFKVRRVLVSQEAARSEQHHKYPVGRRSEILLRQGR
jgi:hypothetical protein